MVDFQHSIRTQAGKRRKAKGKRCNSCVYLSSFRELSWESPTRTLSYITIGKNSVTWAFLRLWTQCLSLLKCMCWSSNLQCNGIWNGHRWSTTIRSGQKREKGTGTGQSQGVRISWFWCVMSADLMGDKFRKTPFLENPGPSLNFWVVIPSSSLYKTCIKILVKWTSSQDFITEQLVGELLPSLTSFFPFWNQWLRRLLPGSEESVLSLYF